MEYEPVIGLEVHVQLRTRTKIFSGASTTYGAEPNTQACAIDLGFPGVLPVLNKEAVKLAVRFGLSIKATIVNHCIFSRKNYFYPDLPKGYQISQHRLPIAKSGCLNVESENGGIKRIGIERAHLEEDVGKSIHEGMQGYSGIDFNRAGMPLLEIVSHPDIRSATEAVTYLKTLHTLVRYINVSDANMQEGAFRCDVNVSLRSQGEKKFGTRAEIKNVNSFRFVGRAILFEIERQKEILENGGRVVQETRLYDAVRNETRPMRMKEEVHDYRYFPDPDLLRVEITHAFIESVKKQLPELPWEKRKRFEASYQLSGYDIKLLSSNVDIANYFETIVKLDQTLPHKLVANWINGDLAAALNKNSLSITKSPVSAEQLATLLSRIADNTLSGSMGKQVFEAMWKGKGDTDSIIEQQGFKQITDANTIEKIIDEVIANNPKQVEQYCAGKKKLIAFFVSQVMKASKSKANPQQINELLKKKL